MQGEAESADLEAAAGYAEDLTKTINKSGYTKKSFGVDKTDTIWDFHNLRREVKTGSEASKDRLTACYGLMHLVTLSWSQCSYTIYYFKNTRNFKNNVQSTWLVLS